SAPRSPICWSVANATGALPRPSRQGALEIGAVLLPPTAAPVEPLLAAHLRPHADEVGVTGFDPSAQEATTVFDRCGQDVEQLCPPGGIERIRVDDEPQSRRLVDDLPAEPRRVDVVVDGHACPRQLCEVVLGPPGSREVEVEQSDGYAVTKDDVLEAHVVV